MPLWFIILIFVNYKFQNEIARTLILINNNWR